MEGFARGIQLRHLRCLVAIAQERHLARAAEKLSLSQPAVSKTLAELEALAGARLVERGRRGARLTAAGEQLLTHALRVLEAVSEAAQSFAPASAARIQRLRVGALPSVAPALLPAALADFQRHRPDAQVQVLTDSNAPLLDALRAGELDLVVGRMSDPPRMVGLTFELLYMEPLALLARPGHPLGRQAEPSMQAVLEFPLVVYSEGTTPRHNTESFLSGFGLKLPLRRTETLVVSVARLLVQQSDAIWFTPLGAAWDDLERGQLMRLDVATPGTEEPVGLLLRSGAQATDALLELVRGVRKAGTGHAGEPHFKAT
ncbi:MAG TPA: LysR substrate-binding domain-containing protein [Burkholderiaceae bacterium]|nr:LysR substrate-binding domain-containing protein [Burkholderiaceae bacterium]